MLNLPAPVREDLSAGRTTVGHARAILGLKSEGEQLDAWKDVVSSGMSVRETEELVRRRGERIVSRETAGKRLPVPAKVDPDLKEAEDRIRKAFGTKVRIHPAGKGGRIEIEYYSPEELDRILELVVR